MQVFLASDVIYAGRFPPPLKVLADEDIGGVTVPASAFVPDIQWLEPSRVADAITGLRTGTPADDEAAGGLHGNGLAAVTLGGTALTPGAGATVQLSSDLAFEVQVANQGDGTETDVNVKIRVGEGADAIDLEGAIDTIAAGETKSVSSPWRSTRRRAERAHPGGGRARAGREEDQQQLGDLLRDLHAVGRATLRRWTS